MIVSTNNERFNTEMDSHRDGEKIATTEEARNYTPRLVRLTERIYNFQSTSKE